MNRYNHNLNPTSFWDVVENMKWFENTKNDTTTNATQYAVTYLTCSYDVDEISDLQREEVAKRMNIEKIIKDYFKSTKHHYTNEALQTLASHIVGLGKKMYEFVQDNPSVLECWDRNNTKCFEDVFDLAIYELND